jgi:hypothetical protein
VPGSTTKTVSIRARSCERAIYDGAKKSKLGKFQSAPAYACGRSGQRKCTLTGNKFQSAPAHASGRWLYSLPSSRGLAARPDPVRRRRVLRRQHGAANRTIELNEVITSLQQLDPVWEVLYPAERRRVLELLVKSVTVTKQSVEVRFLPNGIEQIVDELAPLSERTNG